MIPRYILLEEGVTFQTCSRNAEALAHPADAAYPLSGLAPKITGDVISHGPHFVCKAGLYSPMKLFMILCFQVAHGLLKVLILTMLCGNTQTTLFELDLALGKPGFAPALLRASCVAFGNVFIHPAPQFSRLEKWEPYSYLPRDCEVKLLWTGKC